MHERKMTEDALNNCPKRKINRLLNVQYIKDSYKIQKKI